jgi:RNAse (barnase) inhibitor barstar
MESIPFVFAEKCQIPREGAARIVIIPQNVCSEKQLMRCFVKQLNLEKGFGRNWDALRDVLYDLSWIEQININICHDGILDLSEEEFFIYVRLLGDVAEHWTNYKEHAISIIFPIVAHDKITSLWNRIKAAGC